jgi:hypothetical protein
VNLPFWVLPLVSYESRQQQREDSKMSKKSRWFLGLACAASIVALARFVPVVAVGSGVADFAVGLAAAMMLGTLVTWQARRVE